MVVVKGKDRPFEKNRLGLMRWYLHPSLTNTVIRTLITFVQEIPPGSRTGRLHFQGGQVLYIWEGKGHTILDGVRYDWKQGDAMNLPLRRDGVTGAALQRRPQPAGPAGRLRGEPRRPVRCGPGNPVRGAGGSALKAAGGGFAALQDSNHFCDALGIKRFITLAAEFCDLLGPAAIYNREWCSVGVS